MNVALLAGAAAVAGIGLWTIGAVAHAARATAVLIVLAFVVAVVPVALSDQVRSGETKAATPAESEDPIDFFAERVRKDPQDVGARLDLAAELLAAGDFSSAMTEYLDVLELDPANAGAHARVGLLLFRGGLTEPAMDAVDRALTLRPDLPEALYVKGLVTMMGLKRPAEAKRIFRHYLEVAPFGSYVADVERLLEIDR